jgi:DNA-binding LytR/AlgR family response regulator
LLKIIICDDDRFTLHIFSEILQETIEKLSIEATVLCIASTSDELFSFFNKNPGDYLLFMDLDMGSDKLNGLDIGRIIRQKSPSSKLVFVTSHIEKSMDILKSGVEPFGFIEKDFNRKAMIREFEGYLNMASRIMAPQNTDSGKCIQLDIGVDETVSIPINRITYVEAIKTLAHNICYHTFDNSKITVRDTIKHALEILGNDFVQSHRSVIVNKNYIIGIENTSIKLSNGEHVACSIGKLKDFMKWGEKK